jgi:hypothetical protein
VRQPLNRIMSLGGTRGVFQQENQARSNRSHPDRERDDQEGGSLGVKEPL